THTSWKVGRDSGLRFAAQKSKLYSPSNSRHEIQRHAVSASKDSQNTLKRSGLTTTWSSLRVTINLLNFKHRRKLYPKASTTEALFLCPEAGRKRHAPQR